MSRGDPPGEGAPSAEHERRYPRARVELLARRRDAEGLYELVFDGPPIARSAQPGQFASFRVRRQAFDPLLRRPMSVAFTDGDRFGVLVQTVGVGSRMLADAPLGEEFDVLGPVGQPFPPPLAGSRVAIVGGGVGVAPLRLLHQKHGHGCEVEILVGARTERLLPFRRYLDSTGSAFVATDDGSAGYPGTVADLLAVRHRHSPFARVYACGPPRMLEAVAGLSAEVGVQCFVSLEARMACAMGQCLGCVVPLARGGYARVCTEGPCFDASEVRLDVDLGWSHGR